MDKLLKADITTMASERKELFLFFGRFEEFIGRFNTSYGDVCAKRSQDIEFRTKNAQSILAQMDQQHQNNLKKLDDELNLALMGKRNDLAQAQKQKAKQDLDADNAYKSWEQQKTSELTKRDNDDNDLNNADERRVNEMLGFYNVVKRSMQKKFGKVTKDVKAKDCSDTVDAQNRLSTDSLLRIQKNRDEIIKIQNSLPKKIVFFSKRDDLCRELSQIFQDAKRGAAFLKNERQKKSSERWSSFYAEKQKKQDKIRAGKNKNQTNFQNTERAIQNQIATLKKIYAQKRTSLIAKQEQERKSKSAEQTKELQQTEVKWRNDTQQAFQKFVTQLESEYSSKATLKMMQCAWKKQWTFASMTHGMAQRNVLVGVGFVNVKKWYNGEGGKLVKKILEEKYGFLFYQMPNGKNKKVNSDLLRIPYTLSLETGENLLIECEDSQRNEMETAVQAIAMRLLWAIPAGQVQLLLADAATIGSFSSLTSLDPAVDNTSGTTTVKGILDGDRVCSNATEIQQRIQDNTSRYNSSSGQMGNVKSLREYNVANPLNSRSFLISVIQKFPYGLNEESIQSLRKMGADCGKWGFSSIMCGSVTDFQQVDKKLLPALNKLAKNCVYLKMIHQPKVNQSFFEIKKSNLPLETGCRVFFYPQPDDKTCAEMKRQLREEMISASSKKIDFEQATEICPSVEKRFKEQAQNGIVIPIGYWDGGTPFNMIFDDSRVHAIINGDTGSGKTNLLHVLITNTMLRYSPDEVEMYLIDFKHGTEFRRYTNYKLPSFRMISLCNEPEFALKMLQGIKQELLKRKSLFGDSVTSLKGYIEKTGKKLSRILIIIDELYQMVEETKSIPAGNEIRNEIIKLIKEFAVQSRAYGIHMVISGQNMTNIQEIQVIKNSCATRIALRCSENQVISLIDQEAAKQMRMINSVDKGACVVQAGQGVPSQIEHTAYIEPNKQHICILKEIHNYYSSKNHYPKARVMSTDARSDHESIYQKFVLFKDISTVRMNRFNLGEILSIKTNEGIDLTKKNLWIAGGQSEEAEKAGNSLCYYFLFSLLLQKRVQKGRMNIFLVSSDMERDSFEWNPCIKLGKELPNQVNFVSAGQFMQMLSNVYHEISNRRQVSMTKQTYSPIWIILQKPEELQVQSPQILQILQEILQYGPNYGVQTLIWTMDVKKAVAMKLHEVAFWEKFALQMDSSMYPTILGSKPPVESKNWYVNRTKGSRMRVYDLPETEWVEQTISRFKEE
jgi:hypothetical protein